MGYISKKVAAHGQFVLVFLNFALHGVICHPLPNTIRVNIDPKIVYHYVLLQSSIIMFGSTWIREVVLKFRLVLVLALFVLFLRFFLDAGGGFLIQQPL